MRVALGGKRVPAAVAVAQQVASVGLLQSLYVSAPVSAVLGLPHSRLGQVLTAVVVGSAVDATLRAAVSVMPAPSRPRRWLHADALPLTSGGKLHRDALPGLVARLQQP